MKKQQHNLSVQKFENGWAYAIWHWVHMTGHDHRTRIDVENEGHKSYISAVMAAKEYANKQGWNLISNP